MKSKFLIFLILLNIFITIPGLLGLFQIEEKNISVLFLLNGILLFLFYAFKYKRKKIK